MRHLKRFTAAGFALVVALVVAVPALAQQGVSSSSAWRLGEKALEFRNTGASFPRKLYNGFTGAQISTYADSAWSTHNSAGLPAAEEIDTTVAFDPMTMPDFCLSCGRSAAAAADSFMVGRLVVSILRDGPGVATSRGLTVAGFDTLLYTVQVSHDGGGTWATVDAERTVLAVANQNFIDVNFNTKLIDINAATLTRVNFGATAPLVRFLLDKSAGLGVYQAKWVYPQIIR